MTVIGVAGCTALIIGGLGLKDSLSVIAGRLVQDGVAAKLQRGRFRKIAKFL